MDLTTTYLGLKLDNPIIAGSSGLTDSVGKIQKLEQNGAGAIVLKSIFEEEIVFEHEDILKEAEAAGVNLDQFDYYDFHLKGEKVKKYIDLIKESKKKMSVIAITRKHGKSSKATTCWKASNSTLRIWEQPSSGTDWCGKKATVRTSQSSPSPGNGGQSTP